MQRANPSTHSHPPTHSQRHGTKTWPPASNGKLGKVPAAATPSMSSTPTSPTTLVSPPLPPPSPAPSTWKTQVRPSSHPLYT